MHTAKRLNKTSEEEMAGLYVEIGYRTCFQILVHPSSDSVLLNLDNFGRSLLLHAQVAPAVHRRTREHSSSSYTFTRIYQWSTRTSPNKVGGVVV